MYFYAQKHAITIITFIIIIKLYNLYKVRQVSRPRKTSERITAEKTEVPHLALTVSAMTFVVSNEAFLMPGASHYT
jgi:hypothetical protein